MYSNSCEINDDAERFCDHIIAEDLIGALRRKVVMISVSAVWVFPALKSVWWVGEEKHIAHEKHVVWRVQAFPVVRVDQHRDILVRNTPVNDGVHCKFDDPLRTVLANNHLSVLIFQTVTSSIKKLFVICNGVYYRKVQRSFYEVCIFSI